MKKSVIIILISILPVFLYGQQWILMGEDSICDAGWSDVNSLYNRNDTVYASGKFMGYGPAYTSLRHIGYYANGSWHQMDLGIYNSNGAKTMILYKNRLYIGGGGIGVMTGMPWPNDQIPNTENASRWNFPSQEFEAIPSATGKTIASSIFDYCVYHDTLILAGYCNVHESNGTTVFSWFVVGYNGNDFISMGTLPQSSMAVETFNDQIYIGGAWNTIKRWNGGTGVNNLAAWDDVLTAYNYPAAMDMEVDTFNNFLYIAGTLNLITDPLTNKSDTGNGIVRYDGFTWEAIGSKTNYQSTYGYAVGLYRNELFASMLPDTIDNIDLSGVAKWDDINKQWIPLGKGLTRSGASTGLALDFLELNDTLWIGGQFDMVDSIPNGPIARWHEPAVPCAYIKPRVQCVEDTFYYNRIHHNIEVDFFNNNAYVDTWLWNFDDGGATATTQNTSHTFNAPGTYSVSVTVTHGACSKTATRDIVIIENTGEDELSKESLQFKLFPNPTSGAVSVECTLPQDKTGELRTHLTNGAYKNIYKLQSGFNHVDIPASNISKGLSMVSLFVEGEYIFSEKVIKE